MTTASTFGIALHIHIVQLKLGFSRPMTAYDLLLMLSVTMIYQYLPNVQLKNKAR